MTKQTPSFDLVVRYHEALPARIRKYLNGRGVANSLIDAHALGWNGTRITIPILNRDSRLAFFRLAKDPEDRRRGPKMLTPAGAKAELYGWDSVLEQPHRLVVCEGEFDRLVLESQGFAAVTSTGGAGVFRPEWAEGLRQIPELYVCFDRDAAGRRGAQRVSRLLPAAKIVELPEEVGEGGDVSDFFVRLRRSREDFLQFLDGAAPIAKLEQSPVRRGAPRVRTSNREIDELKGLITLEQFVAEYVKLHRSRQHFVGRCPFHEDRTPSFVVYPHTQSFYCFGCQAHGDVITFLMMIEDLTFAEAVEVLRKLVPRAA